MEARDIFERDKLGEEISHQDPEYHKIREMIDEAQKLILERILGLVKMFLSIIVVPLWIGEELH